MANNGFGYLADYFALQSSALRLISSDSGRSRLLVQTSHTGKIDAQHLAASMSTNPVCTYMVVADTTVDVTLGTAFNGNSGKFFVTGAEILTQLGNFPTVTVYGTANEGADAINTWRVQVPVIARARAQNLLSAVSTSHELQSFRLMAKCDPIVLYENLLPCASDITHGKLVADVTVLNSSGAASVSAASGWSSVGIPLVGGDTLYSTMSITAERSLS